MRPTFEKMYIMKDYNPEKYSIIYLRRYCYKMLPQTQNFEVDKLTYVKVLYRRSLYFIFTTFSIYVLYTFSIRSIYVLYTFYIRSIYVLYTFYIRSIYVLYTFYIRSIYVLYIIYAYIYIYV